MSRFEAWLANSLPGEAFTYHQGRVLRQSGPTSYARKAFNDGLVELAQRRISRAENPNSVGEFAWIAIKKENPRRPSHALAFPKEFFEYELAN